MSHKSLEDMTPAERQEWAMLNMPLSDDPAPPQRASPSGGASHPLASPNERDPDGRGPGRRPESPIAIVLVGGALFFAGLLFFALALDAGELGLVLFSTLLIVPGAVLLLHGTVAASVRLGMRHARWEAARE